MKIFERTYKKKMQTKRIYKVDLTKFEKGVVIMLWALMF